VNKNIEHYVFHKRKFLDEKHCENCIDELDKCAWEKHKWRRGSDQASYHSAGDNEPENTHPGSSENIGEINDFIIKKLQSTISEYIYKISPGIWFDTWLGYTALKFIRYYPGQTMHPHWDHIHDIFDGERQGIPTLSIIGVLNDDFEGGELIMFEDKKIDTKKGDLIIFPSNFLYPHEITPVIKGVRYSYQSWVW